MRTIETDVVIVGTGFGAAAPALRLSEAGFKVVMIEKGPRIEAPRDFRQTQDPKYLLRYLKQLSGERISLTYAEGLGGGSGFYEMVSLRAPSLAFEQRDAQGKRLWPAALNRGALDPYYAIAERMLNVEQIAIEEVPKTGLVFARMMKNLGYTCDRARYAVRGCVGSGFCVTGCIYGAKQSLHMNYLPKAEGVGARVITDLEATTIRTLCDVLRTPRSETLSNVPYRYEVLCRPTGKQQDWHRLKARLVILAGGTVGTARLLLRSKEYLRRLSHEVGRNIAFNGGVKVAGLLPKTFPAGDMFTGRSHPGMISYEFLESNGITISAAKPLPLQAVAAARLKLDGDEQSPGHWGGPNVDLMKLYRKRVMVLVAFGLTRAGAELTLSANAEPRLHLEFNDELRSYYVRVKVLLNSILQRNGCRLINTEFHRQGVPYKEVHFSTAHQVGSCRMADSRMMGAADAAGEVFGYPGLYVTDGAAIPTSLAVNTSLTILANAERIAAIVLRRYPLAKQAADLAASS
ncbi:MAG: GMC family oxidoreductase [Gemmatimonadota bacterium]|jgi:choline dehydrogenase-like flavoprotein